jgi:hypothetical protein
MSRTALPNMHGDAAQVHQRKLRLERTAHDVSHIAVRVMNHFGRSTGRQAGGRFFLIETFTEHAVRAALHGEQAASDVRLQFREDRLVEASQVKLGVALVRPEDFVRIGDDIRQSHLALSLG